MLEDQRSHTVPGRLSGNVFRKLLPRRRVFIAVSAAIACLLALASCALPVGPAQGTQAGVPVRFGYVDAKAREVCLAGSFNDWSARSHCLTKTGDTWTLDVLLPPGRHQYAYLIDGKIWREDPGAVLSEETGFGTRNSILIVD